MKTYEQRTEDILQKAKVQKKRNAKRITAWCSVAASALLVFNLVMFVPYNAGGYDVTVHADSEYYKVIEQLAPLTYGKPYKTNNFTQVFSGFSGCTSKGNDMIDYPAVDDGLAWGVDTSDRPLMSPDSDSDVGDSNNSPSSGNENYNEVTNNQTKGVTEGDLFKRSDKYIYYLSYIPAHYDVIIDEAEHGYSEVKVYEDAKYVLKAYSIEGENSEQVAEYTISPEENLTYMHYTYGREMYLSEDCKTINVITPCYNKTANQLYTQIISIDVSDLKDVKQINSVFVSGQYISSRIVDGNMLLVCNFAVKSRPDFENETDYLPQIGKVEDMHTLPLDDIVCPDDTNSATYTVVCSLNEKTLEVKDKLALLSFSKELYVSKNNLFVTREYSVTTETKNEYNLTYTNRVTDIYQVEYNNGTLMEKGSVQVDGTILDRYCMDEYEGVLRVFTNVAFVGNYSYSGKDDPYDYMRGENFCNLYCIDLDTKKTIAKEIGFAPVGESVRSARFYGNTAYVCTAMEIKLGLTDPVFAFDLSDYNNITYKDTGTIPGYSLSLIAFTDDTLLGIGYGDFRSDLKIEIYRQTANKVDSVTEYVSENTSFSSKFKAYFIDAENGLIGLATRVNWDKTCYTLLQFDGYNLHRIASVEIDEYNCDEVRATYVDGYMYLLATDTFTVINL